MYSCYRFVKFYHTKPIKFDANLFLNGVDWFVDAVFIPIYHSNDMNEMNVDLESIQNGGNLLLMHLMERIWCDQLKESWKRLGAANFAAILYFLRMPFSIAKLAGFEAIDRSITNRRCTLDIIVSQFQHFVIFAVTAMDPANDTQGYYCIYLFTFCTLPDAHFCTSFLHTCYDPT